MILIPINIEMSDNKLHKTYFDKLATIATGGLYSMYLAENHSLKSYNSYVKTEQEKTEKHNAIISKYIQDFDKVYPKFSGG